MSTLQHQVSALQASRETQDRELSRLRAEALALAASSATLEQRSVQSVAALAGQANSAASAVKDQVRRASWLVMMGLHFFTPGRGEGVQPA